MVTNIKDILKRLEFTETGSYDNHFYVIPLKDSNDYARMYSKLDKNAINTEYPNFAKNTNNATTKITNYFEVEVDSVTYDLFLFADFAEGKYYLKITDRDN